MKHLKHLKPLKPCWRAIASRADSPLLARDCIACRLTPRLRRAETPETFETLETLLARDCIACRLTPQLRRAETPEPNIKKQS
jgi:hypothetical protein